MPLDRDRQLVGSVENRACAACNRSGIPIRNALCAECAQVHWFCPECGRILDRDSDAVCTCGFPLARYEERLVEIDREEARKRGEHEARLSAEERYWHRRIGLWSIGAGAVLIATGAVLGFVWRGTTAIVVLGLGVLVQAHGLYKRFRLGA